MTHLPPVGNPSGSPFQLTDTIGQDAHVETSDLHESNGPSTSGEAHVHDADHSHAHGTDAYSTARRGHVEEGRFNAPAALDVPDAASTSQASRGMTSSVGSAMTRESNGFLKFLLALVEALAEVFTLGFYDSETFNHEDSLRDAGRTFVNENPAFAMAGTDIHRFGMGSNAWRGELRDQLAQRIMSHQGASGNPIDLSTAQEYADVMLEGVDSALEEHRTQGREMSSEDLGTRLQRSDLSGPLLNDYQEAAELIPQAAAIAQARGEPWSQSFERILQSSNPTVLRDRVEVFLYVSQAQSQGMLPDVGEEHIAGLLNVLVRNEATSVAHVVSALQTMPAGERRQFLAALDSAPDEIQLIAYAMLAREYFAVSGNSEDRADALARLQATVTQMGTVKARHDANPPTDGTSAGQATFTELAGLLSTNRLGMIESSVDIGHGIEVPVFFHPGIPQSERQGYLDMITQSYATFPRPVLEAMQRGEDDRPLEIHIAPGASFETDRAEGRTNPNFVAQGRYGFDRNTLYLNTSELDAATPGRRLHIVRHEGWHAFSDLAVSGESTGIAGVMSFSSRAGWDSPLGRHFQAISRRFDQRLQDVQLEVFGAEERVDLTDDEFEGAATDAGAVSSYGATGGQLGRSDRRPVAWDGRIEEFLAESLTTWSTPTDRARLQQLDPVLAETMSRVYAHFQQGNIDEAVALLTTAPSPTTAAAVASEVLGSRAALTDDQLGQVDAAVTAFDVAAAGFDGWTSPNARVTEARDAEKQAIITRGGTLLETIRSRAASATGSEQTRLQAMATRLDASLTQLQGPPAQS